MKINPDEFVVDPGSSVLVAIDFQRDLLTGDDGQLLEWALPVVETAQRLTSRCRESSIPIVWVRVIRRPDFGDVYGATTELTLRSNGKRSRTLMDGTLGAQLVSEMEPHDTDYHVCKPRVNAFYGSRLEVYLRRLRAATVVFAGVYTHMGVEATVRAAYDRDFDSVVVADACGAPSSSVHDHAVERVLPAMAVVRKLTSLNLTGAQNA